MFQALHENIKKFALALDMGSWAVMFQLKGSKEKSLCGRFKRFCLHIRSFLQITISDISPDSVLARIALFFLQHVEVESDFF